MQVLLQIQLRYDFPSWPQVFHPDSRNVSQLLCTSETTPRNSTHCASMLPLASSFQPGRAGSGMVARPSRSIFSASIVGAKFPGAVWPITSQNSALLGNEFEKLQCTKIPRVSSWSENQCSARLAAVTTPRTRTGNWRVASSTGSSCTWLMPTSGKGFAGPPSDGTTLQILAAGDAHPAQNEPPAGRQRGAANSHGAHAGVQQHRRVQAIAIRHAHRQGIRAGTAIPVPSLVLFAKLNSHAPPPKASAVPQAGSSAGQSSH